jgi:hypothetical protein
MASRVEEPWQCKIDADRATARSRRDSGRRTAAVSPLGVGDQRRRDRAAAPSQAFRGVLPSFLEARRPAEQSIVAVVMETYVTGGSTRKGRLRTRSAGVHRHRDSVGGRRARVAGEPVRLGGSVRDQCCAVPARSRCPELHDRAVHASNGLGRTHRRDTVRDVDHEGHRMGGAGLTSRRTARRGRSPSGLSEGNQRVLDPSMTWYGAGGKPMFPWHPYTQAAVTPVLPVQMIRYDVEVLPTFDTLEPGHRLRITIAASQTSRAPLRRSPSSRI